MWKLAARHRVKFVCLVFSCCLCCVSSGHAQDGKSGLDPKKAGNAKSVDALMAGTGRSRSRLGSEGISAKSLDALLKSKSETLWEKGLSSVTPESLEHDDIVEVISRFAKREATADHFSPWLVQAITFLSEAKQGSAFEQLESLLSAKDFRTVMATADIASMTQDRGFLASLMKLAENREYKQRYGFRRCVTDAVARYREKTAIDFLVDRLDHSDGQLKYEIARNLERATGQEFGGKAADWQTWWQKHCEDFVFASRVAEPESVILNAPPKQIAWEESRPSFYGMTIYAKRVVFVIDRSGSMASSVNGETRLAKAQQELQRAIKALSETDSFNMVAFDDRMEVFRSKLVPATESNKREGIRFAYGLEPRGETACYEPLKMGLEASNDLELMLFLSDGEPNAGALPDPSGIVIAVSNHNLTQRTTINTLGIDARDAHEEFLKNLAEKNLGKLLLIR